MFGERGWRDEEAAEAGGGSTQSGLGCVTCAMSARQQSDWGGVMCEGVPEGPPLPATLTHLQVIGFRVSRLGLMGGWTR